ncbi:MAG: response regulator [Patescibacteria group bacterium]
MHKPPLVLLVDDDPSIISLFSTKLSSAGFSIIKAYNGKDCCDLAKKEKPDLILMDLRMPIMDGFEALKKLNSDPETTGTKVIIISSFNDWSAMKMTQDTARHLGALDFVEKGIDLNELVSKVHKLVDEHLS